MLDYKTPGVWIEEQAATGPISGVGTSNAAFLGAAQSGPINEPTMITNFTEFRDTFGSYITQPGHYLAYAVRGFFDNGGTVAYIVRVGTAARAALPIDDRAGGAGRALRVQARQEGVDGNNIRADVTDAQLVPPGNNARVRKVRVPTTGASSNVVTLANLNDASLFSVGDIVTVEASGERRGLVRISGNQLVLDNTVTTSAASNVRIADLAIGQTSFRVENGANIEPGSVLHIAQQAGNQEDVVVRSMANGFVTVEGAGLQNTYTMDNAANDTRITSFEFTLVITKAGSPTETYAGLSMDSRHSRYFARVVNSPLVDVMLPIPPTLPSNQAPPLNRPAVLGGPTALLGGADDNLSAIGLAHYQNALAALEKVDDVQIVAAPGRTDAGVQGALVAHCEKLQDRFAILDSARNASPRPTGAGTVGEQRALVDSSRGYAALYYPWIVIFDPASLSGDDKILVPPSGHMAGIYARSDSTRGVHKAPANEFITGPIDLERKLDDAEQGELNVLGINVLRIFPGSARPTVWGARTTTPRDLTPWRYINVRRLFIYVEESIQQGVRWAVFEPNDLGLWKKLDRTITEFLTRVWRSGALFGARREHAFYVKIDEELNPASIRALGQVIIEIGIAPVRPAEFVVVRIGIWDGGSEANES